MNKGQIVTWNLLLILAIALLLVGAWGDWFRGILEEITTYHPTKLTFNPLTNPLKNPLEGLKNPFEQKPSDPPKQTTFDIPLVGGGFVHQNAADLQSAIANVRATGNIPAIG